MSQKQRTLPTLVGLGDNYEIVRELGRGGTAVVYLARDTDLERDVAVKVIRSTYVEDEEAMARLLREARTVAGMQHPNIVQLYGTRKLDDGSLALVMQYVPGRSLKAVIRASGPLTYAQAGQVLTDVGRALSYAHRRRVVHRDIKPENIYVDDETGIARLSDFGIARAWDSDSNLTLPGMALGTPAYMSPEQIDGRDLDGRSDLYSLGLVGYEMLTGQQPWAGENLYTIIYRQKQDELVPLADLRPDIPPHLQRAIDVALTKHRDERWTDADDFVQQVQAGPLPATPAPRELVLRPRGPDGPGVSEDAATLMYRRPEAGETDGQPPAEDTAPPVPSAGTSVAVQETAAPPAPAAPGRKAQGRRQTVATTAAMAAAIVVISGGLWALSQGRATGTDDPPGLDGEALAAETDPAAVGIEPSVHGSDAAAAGDGEGDPAEGTSPESDAGRTPDDPPPASGPIPAALQALAGDRQDADPGTVATDPLVVRVEDAFGGPLEGAVVEFTVSAGGGFVNPASAVTDASGLVSVEWMLGMDQGEQSVVASVRGLPGPRARFRANAAPEAGTTAAALTVVEGDGQQAPMGGALPESLVVELTDGGGQPVAGVPVRFDVTVGGGSVTPARGVTGADGRLEARWVLGSGSAENAVSVVAEGLEQVPVVLTARGIPSALSVGRTIVAGGTHTCAVTGDGTPYCWGGNANGQLGEEGARRSTPGLVDGALTLATIAAGFGHTCGVAPDGVIYCWGGNESGQLGDGTTGGRAVPRPVAGDLRFAAVAAGVSHTCALAAGGRAFCWGGNLNGQLGDGTRASRSTPGQVVAPVNTFRMIAVGWTHTCALTRGGTAYCWGRNAHGHLGDGSGVDRIEPAQVTGVPTFRTLSAGSAHTCGVTPAGDAYCWGQNTYGQLGDGTTQNRTAPVRVSGIESVARIAAGGVHTCALTEAGATYCWGRNTYGQLGNGTTTDQLTPVPVSGDLTLASLFASGAHTCGSNTAGRSYCWGYNVDGQLGDGSRGNRSVPTQVLRLPR
jgi:serine/threonine protein kinase/alpha-tubulin suppressor-like RCC1 family protein